MRHNTYVLTRHTKQAHLAKRCHLWGEELPMPQPTSTLSSPTTVLTAPYLNINPHKTAIGAWRPIHQNKD